MITKLIKERERERETLTHGQGGDAISAAKKEGRGWPLAAGFAVERGSLLPAVLGGGVRQGAGRAGVKVRQWLLGQGRGWGGHGEDSGLRGQQGRWGKLGHPLVVGIEEID